MDTQLISDKPVDHYKNGADLFGALAAVMAKVEEGGTDRLLYHLMLLRASQMNGCGYCVRMHTREAREDGETNARLDELIIWRHSEAFSPAEKAALAWTEALTKPESRHSFADLRLELRRHFTDGEITALTAIVAMINLWNRFHIGNH